MLETQFGFVCLFLFQQQESIYIHTTVQDCGIAQQLLADSATDVTDRIANKQTP